MIVVSDISPLNYPVLIDEIGLLPQLYGRVIVPAAVHRELTHPDSPEAVRRWASSGPAWLDVRQTASLPLGLDAGEQEAISLALSLGAGLILMDERKGRRTANAQSLAVTGTLGVLEAAARRGLIAIVPTVARLRQTNFHASPEVIAAMLRRCGTGPDNN